MDASTQTAPNNEPSNPPFIRSGHLAAPGFSEHRIYWEEYGSLAGEPVIVMHGGPGAGSHSSSARFFNPQRYRVVLFDQRGCGKSMPSASDDDATPALTDNTTQHLIDDVSALRHELNITHYTLFGLQDADSSKADLFHQFGIMHDDYTPKPAFWTYRHLIRRLGPSHR